MIQQTIQIGNSIGVIIPKNVLEEKKIRVGDKIQVDVKPIKKIAGGVDAVIDPEIYAVAKSLLKRYGKAFAELAKK